MKRIKPFVLVSEYQRVGLWITVILLALFLLVIGIPPLFIKGGDA